MSARKRFHGFHEAVTLAAILLLSLACARVWAAQGKTSLLQITSPAPGTVFNPGQSVPVTVTSPANEAFTQVTVIGGDPLGEQGASSAPAHFTFAIPPSIDALQQYSFTAVAVASSEQVASSEPVSIDVERSDNPVSLSAQTSSITFQWVGDQVAIQLLANFPDGSQPEVTRSSYVEFSSSNANIASVDKEGNVTAAGYGTARVTVTYSHGGHSMRLVIPVTVTRQAPN